jgi:hypothetical protein
MRLTIDTARIRHALRRWWWNLRRRLGAQPKARGTCMDCGDELTPDEAYYYGHTCEMCEAISFHKMEGL